MKLPKLNYSNNVFWNGPGFSLDIERVTGSEDRFLRVGQLNPQSSAVGRFSRWDIFRMGMYFIWRSLFARAPAENVTHQSKDRAE